MGLHQGKPRCVDFIYRDVSHLLRVKMSRETWMTLTSNCPWHHLHTEASHSWDQQGSTERGDAKDIAGLLLSEKEFINHSNCLRRLRKIPFKLLYRSFSADFPDTAEFAESPLCWGEQCYGSFSELASLFSSLEKEEQLNCLESLLHLKRINHCLYTLCSLLYPVNQWVFLQPQGKCLPGPTGRHLHYHFNPPDSAFLSAKSSSDRLFGE
ncbi:hypothetical protein Y1Q_0013489 [Alligator mississippiensis]|uniref:Uncharacterized protein n=1 Tax=Alligator mississippiensis TaxID=8496 RepID=A0A151P2X9_ALLMI|nr:hypothetical protein Y1Q_0013489 [Alligator mississippiensis]